MRDSDTDNIVLITDEGEPTFEYPRTRPEGAPPGPAFTEQFKIRILRCSDNDKSIIGEMFVNGTFLCHTLELPYLNNQSYISSFPPGTYPAFLRYDKKDKWRLQLRDVPGHTGIQIHIGNFPSDTKGCVLVGDTANNNGNSIGGSGSAYSRLKRSFYGSDNPTSTPDYELSVHVDYAPRRTKFINRANAKHYYEYVTQGKWHEIYPGNPGPNKYGESKRDLQHVYIKDGAFELRIPLQGGHPDYRIGGGAWRKSPEPYRREN